MASRVGKESGSLSRANQIIVGSTGKQNPIAILSYFSDNQTSSPPSLKRSRLIARRRLNSIPEYSNPAGLVISRARQSNINFLFRWFLLRKRDELDLSIDRPDLVAKINKTRRQTLCDLLLKDVTVNCQGKRDYLNIVKHIFYRWLTWTNLFELLLLIVLCSSCVYQCYELLDDYYKYPTHVSVTKILNDDFRTDIPGVTICNNNGISNETLRKKYPQWTDQHYMAMSQGAYVSLYNYSIPNKEKPIDWLAVLQFLNQNKPSDMSNHVPSYDLIDTITCANIWGEMLPCANVSRIANIQGERICYTLFHDSVLWDPRMPAIKELEQVERKITNNAPTSNQNAASSLMVETLSDEELLQLIDQNSITASTSGEQFNNFKNQVELANMEVLRLRLNFRRNDYANKLNVIGGLVAVHSNSVLGMMSHSSYSVKPGHWYTFHVERFDFRRLPKPYDTNCYDYAQSRTTWQDRLDWMAKERAKIGAIIQRQVASPGKLLPEYADVLRRRALGGRECIYICSTELALGKCKCWPKNTIYSVGNHDTVQNSLEFCDYEQMLKQPSVAGNLTSGGQEIAGEDLHFQLCTKDYSFCWRGACPDECDHSNFDVIQQTRVWPSLESRLKTIMEDLLGTGTVMKQVLVPGHRQDDLDMEAPRNFFALIDIETYCNNRYIDSESHVNFLLNSDADLFAGPHLVIPLMDINEKSRYIFDPKFCYGELGNLPDIPANARLECIITLRIRVPFDDFLELMTLRERLNMAMVQRDRGRFWFLRGDFNPATTLYQSMLKLCALPPENGVASTSNSASNSGSNFESSVETTTTTSSGDGEGGGEMDTEEEQPLYPNNIH